ncbi:MAG: hypothetical protein HY816_09110 [Candidatus Wallbacteria bacterium]|nr:hypothetical protein [Candidatus Wallbacteria bacterium]
MIASQAKVEAECERVEAGLAQFTRQGNLTELGDAQDAIETLRELYRAQPASVAPHLERIKRLADAVREEIVAQQDALAAEYAAVAQEEMRLAERKRKLRAALVEACRVHGDKVVQVGAVRGTRLSSLRLPPAKSPGRAELEQRLRDAGRYDEFTMLAAAKLQSAFQRGQLSVELSAAVSRLCGTEPNYRLVLADGTERPRSAEQGNAGASHSLEELLGPDEES